MRLYTDPHRFFEGAREGDEFKIRRIPGYYNAFLPQITVSAAPAPGGALIDVAMQVRTPTMIMLTLWSLPWLALMALAWSTAPEVLPFTWIMVSIVPVLGAFLFWYEVPKAREKLLAVFGGTLAR